MTTRIQGRSRGPSSGSASELGTRRVPRLRPLAVSPPPPPHSAGFRSSSSGPGATSIHGPGTEVDARVSARASEQLRVRVRNLKHVANPNSKPQTTSKTR
ncbi:hypothetical protein L249_8688 [Ophiocordyceps polyrhachis-furcata BCC 54312]|uniref:Uncharacterized protein n=1 Tax=Ophiocordyceps polyrhachis-furcata BCC 54312 TaxID=1330021 RepID=A0A367L700_9HYPO|nr:hypothetical protein L249_8688 [Ophiocordyceps polyrhachis-furcata BCC 54312]